MADAKANQRPGPAANGVMTAEQVAARAGVSVGTIKRWVKAGAIPNFNGEWTAASAAHARIVSQLRRNGQPLEDIVAAAKDGRLALGSADSLFQNEGVRCCR
ncbi:MAG: hypothetical protein HZB14_02275 [Actinobacteria bacterium]|nr:hypothetical protein [Actinomycetota bacterium]